MYRHHPIFQIIYLIDPPSHAPRPKRAHKYIRCQIKYCFCRIKLQKGVFRLAHAPLRRSKAQHCAVISRFFKLYTRSTRPRTRRAPKRAHKYIRCQIKYCICRIKLQKGVFRLAHAPFRPSKAQACAVISRFFKLLSALFEPVVSSLR